MPYSFDPKETRARSRMADMEVIVRLQDHQAGVCGVGYQAGEFSLQLGW